MVLLFLMFWGTSILSIVAAPVYLLANSTWGSLFSTSSWKLVISCLFNNGHSNTCDVIPRCGFDLHLLLFFFKFIPRAPLSLPVQAGVFCHAQYKSLNKLPVRIALFSLAHDGLQSMSWVMGLQKHRLSIFSFSGYIVLPHKRHSAAGMPSATSGKKLQRWWQDSEQTPVLSLCRENGHLPHKELFPQLAPFADCVQLGDCEDLKVDGAPFS